MLGWFRRHATVLMVVLGSAAMVIFGLGPAFDQLARGGGGEFRELNEVVARWNGGDLRRNDLDQLQRNHYSMQRFLRALREAAIEKKGDAINSMAIPIPPLQGTTQDAVDEELVYRFILAERAKEEGIVASDGMVDDYLALIALSEDFNLAEHRAINKVANPNTPLDIIRDHLKLELLSNQIRIYSQGGTFILPNPTEAMELYGKTSNQVECEVLPIVVEDYISKVTEKPSASELKKIYEEGKYDYPDVSGIKPGFKIPRKVNVQYFKANYDYFLEKEMAKLTDAEVQAEYERLVKEKDNLVMEPATEPDPSIELNELPPESESPNKSDGGEEDAPEGVAPPPSTGGDKTDGSIKDEKSSTDDKSSESDKTDGPALTAPEENAQAKEKEKSSADDKKDSKTEDTEKPAEKTESGEKEKSESESAESEKESDSETDKKEDESSKEDESKKEDEEQDNLSALISGRRDQWVSTAAPQSDDQTSDDDQVQPPPQTESSSAEDSTAESESTDQATEQSSTSSESAAETEDAPAQPERKPKPLSEVADAVKRSMCRQAVRDAMNELIRDKAYNKIEDYSQDLVDAEADREFEDPGELDAASIGKEYNLDFEETGLVSFEELSNLEIGRQFLFVNVGSGVQQQTRPIPVPQLIFSDFNRLRKFDAKAVDSFLQDSYLYWVSEIKEARVPEFSECKKEVEDYWRRQRAFELAKAEAESIQRNVNNQSGNKMLDELYPGRAQKTGAFTWMTNSSQTGYSQPNGVKFVGEEFMAVAFSLDQFKAGVAANEFRDTIYVVQRQTEPKPVSETGTDYIENQFFRFKRVPNEVGFASNLLNSRKAGSDWYDETFKDMGLKFLNQ